MFKSKITLTDGSTMSDVGNEKCLEDTINLIKGLRNVSQGQDKNGNHLFIKSAFITDERTGIIVWVLP